jgi:hypothetical protein
MTIGSDARKPEQHLEFPHAWTAEILARPPLIAPARQFVYPAEVEEVERGALLVEVRPERGSVFLGTFAVGFADPAVPTGVWSCPDPDWLCAASGGYAYLVNTGDPRDWKQAPYRPVLEIRALADDGLLLFVGHHSLMAWGRDGEAWQTGRLSWEGVRITGVGGGRLTGFGWDLMSDAEVAFEVDLRTGKHSGGAGPG